MNKKIAGLIKFFIVYKEYDNHYDFSLTFIFTILIDDLFKNSMRDKK